MPENIKAIRLYQSLNKEQKLGLWTYIKRAKGRNKLVHLLFEKVQDYTKAKNIVKGKLTWEAYLAQIKIEKKIYSHDTFNALSTEINHFLLSEQRETESEIQDKIELYYIYRKLGLHTDNKILLKQIEASMKNCNNLHLRFLFAQIQQEMNLLEDQDAAHTNTFLADTFDFYWITEYIFFACNHKKKAIEMIDSYLNVRPELAKNDTIRLYSSLHSFINIPQNGFSVAKIHEVGDFIENNLPNLPSYRARDVFSLFYNALLAWYKNNRTYPNLEVLWSYEKKGIEQNWFHIGKMLPFQVYKNFITNTILLFDGDSNQQKMELENIQKKYMHTLPTTNEHEKEIELLNYIVSYYTKQDYDSIYALNSARFTEKKLFQKSRFILLQLKAGFASGMLALSIFENLDTKLNACIIHKDMYNSTKEELAIWKAMASIELKLPNKEECKQILQEWLTKYEKKELVFPDRIRYIGVIKGYV